MTFDGKRSVDVITLARKLIDMHGADSNRSSVRMARALLDGAHDRDGLRSEVERLNNVVSGIASSHVAIHAERDAALDEIARLRRRIAELEEVIDAR